MNRAEQQESKQKSKTTSQESTKTRVRGRNENKKRGKANDRERSRMEDIRRGFKMLRKCIPGKFAPPFKHLPKIQILRFAMTYISELRDILESDDNREVDFSGKNHPVLKSTQPPIDYGDAFSPPVSDNETANVTRFDQGAISQFHRPAATKKTVHRYFEAGSTRFDPAPEYLQTLHVYSNPNTTPLSPAPPDTSLTDFELPGELQELLTPVSSQEAMVYLEDFLDEEVMSSTTTKCGVGEIDNCFVCLDF